MKMQLLMLQQATKKMAAKINQLGFKKVIITLDPTEDGFKNLKILGENKSGLKDISNLIK